MSDIYSSTTLALTDIRIDPEFASLCPPLAPDEFVTLEESIVAEGCRDALVAWAEHNILLDGHNRKRICDKHGLGYDVIDLSLPDRDSAIAWVLRNQLGRRNLHPDAASLMRGRLYNLQKKTPGAPEGNDNRAVQRSQSGNIERTAERLASELGVGERTIIRDGKFAEAVDTLRPFVPDIDQSVLSGDIPSRQAVIEAAKEPEKARDKMAVHYSSESPEWYSPTEIIERTERCLGAIDLDPCSNSHDEPNVPAAKHYTADDDGLTHPWHGRAYMNPPYGSAIGDWIQHLCEEYEAGRLTAAIALVPARTDTAWFRRMKQYPRCFVWGRLRFSGHDNSAPFPSMVVYLGSDLAAFRQVFGDIGDIYQLA